MPPTPYLFALLYDKLDKKSSIFFDNTDFVIANKSVIKIYYQNKDIKRINGKSLDESTSQLIFTEKSNIDRIEVELVI